MEGSTERYVPTDDYVLDHAMVNTAEGDIICMEGTCPCPPKTSISSAYGLTIRELMNSVRGHLSKYGHTPFKGNGGVPF